MASQGFSAFAASGGRIRMIVRADLDQEDFAAILRRDEQRAIHKLSHELDTHINGPKMSGAEWSFCAGW